MADKKIHEREQTQIWDHFQNEGVKSFSQSRPRLNYIVEQIDPGSKLLNIGVGGAILEDLAIKKGIDVHSLDPNERAIEKLRDRYKLGEKAQIGYSDNIPFGDNVFDVVVMSEVLEHLNEVEFDRSVKEVVRVLGREALFIVTVPFEEDLLSNEAICPHCGGKFHRWGHQQSFSILRLRQLLGDTGLTVEKIEARCFPDWSRNGVANTIKSCVRYILGRFHVGIARPSIYLKAVKK